MKGEIKMLEFLSFLALCIACKLIQFSLLEKVFLTLLYIFGVLLKYANKDEISDIKKNNKKENENGRKQNRR